MTLMSPTSGAYLEVSQTSCENSQRFWERFYKKSDNKRSFYSWKMHFEGVEYYICI